MIGNPIRCKSNWIEKGTFKIIIRLHEPIRGDNYFGGNPNLNITSFIISSCSKLELLLDNRNLFQSQQRDKLVKQIQDTVRKIDSSKDVKKYLEDSGIGRVFPSVLSLFQNSTPQKSSKGNSIEDYLYWMMVLNQLVTISSQLRKDVTTIQNHKYLAHQIALLYQCLNQAGDHGIIYKRRIEQMFDTIKGVTESSKVPLLSNEQKDWLVNLTTDIIKDISDFITFKQKLEPLLDYLKA